MEFDNLMLSLHHMKKQTILFLFIIHLCILLVACKDYSPKPAGYLRIDLPESGYSEREFPEFSFQLSTQAEILFLPPSDAGAFFNIIYPQLNAQIYCSHIAIKNKKLMELSEESRKFVYLHSARAEAIREQIFENQEYNVFGIRYAIKGNVASPVQFTLTDSVRSFFRGALYFDNTPNQDSIAPVLEYINNDIQVLMESFRWKK